MLIRIICWIGYQISTALYFIERNKVAGIISLILTIGMIYMIMYVTSGVFKYGEEFVEVFSDKDDDGVGIGF